MVVSVIVAGTVDVTVGVVVKDVDAVDRDECVERVERVEVDKAEVVEVLIVVLVEGANWELAKTTVALTAIRTTR